MKDKLTFREMLPVLIVALLSAIFVCLAYFPEHDTSYWHMIWMVPVMMLFAIFMAAIGL